MARRNGRRVIGSKGRRKARGKSKASADRRARRGRAATSRRRRSAGSRRTRARASARSGARNEREQPSSGGAETGAAEVSLDALGDNEEESGSEVERARRDADAMVGDEEPGGTVSVPDHDQVDQWAESLGVERSPDSPVRGSAELLDDRDRRRGGRRPAPKL